VLANNPAAITGSVAESTAATNPARMPVVSPSASPCFIAGIKSLFCNKLAFGKSS